MPGDNVIIGGVTFNRNDVKSHTERTMDGKANAAGEFKQYTQHQVELRDGVNGQKGTIVVFGEQLENLKPKVELAANGAVNFYGLYNAEIIDTENDDIYNLIGCKFTHVQANRTKTYETGGGCTRKKTVTVSADADKITAYRRPYGDVSHWGDAKSEGNSAKINYFGNDEVSGDGISSN